MRDARHAVLPPGAQSVCVFRLSDLERSVEELQREASVSHKLAPVQDLEEKAALIRKLGETLTELKSQSPPQLPPPPSHTASHTHTHTHGPACPVRA